MRDLGTLCRRRFGETGAKPRRGGVDTNLAAGLGVDEGQLTDIGQVALPRIVDLDGDDLVARSKGGHRPEPVARTAEVRYDDDEAATRCGGGDELECGGGRCSFDRYRGCRFARQVRGVAREQQRREQAVAAYARWDAPVGAITERHDPEAVAALRREVPDGERDALGDVGLPTERRTERHRGGEVEHEP